MTSACPSCRSAVPPDARYCPACGVSLYRDCPVCGVEQAASAAFCSACGTPLQPSAGRVAPVAERDERRVVTIMFADLAGSTALAESLEPEDVRVLQGELFELAHAEVERFGGVTEKFVGDAILAVFGIPRAHEDDAERAVRAAIAIRERFAGFASRLAAEHGAEVGLRIGIATGQVVAGREAAARGELMVTGDAVNVAARLQQLAEPGEALVGERTWLATRRAIAYRERGELVAKGKALPVRAWSALGAVAPLGSVREGRGSFVGREDETALLRLAASRVARERAPQLVTIFGHAGVGKSRLVSEFVSSLDGALVLAGRCVPYGDGITYLPLAEVASVLAGIRDDEPARDALAKLEACVAATVPPDQRAGIVEALRWTMGLSLPGRRETGIGPGDGVTKALHGAWTTYLAALGRESLVVLLIEDIHWASEALLDLLEDVVAGLEDTAVLIVCPSRPELLEARPTWGTGRLESSSITLAPLNLDEAGGLLRSLLGSDADPDDVAPAILARTEGNPFFLEELVAMLVEQGAIEERDGRWVATDRLALTSVPDSIHGVIAARLDLLDERERDALRRCSVMGRAFWPSAVDVDDDLVATLGRRGIASEQLQSSFSGRREFMFKHALTHEVAYATLPRYERGSLHRRVADWLSEVAPDRQAETSELIAFHLDQAVRWGGADDDVRRQAYEATLAAGDAALRRGAFSNAALLLERALELAVTLEERLQASLTTAWVDIQSRRFDSALARLETVATEARRNADPRLLSDALALRTRAAWLSGRWAEALEAALEAVAALEGLPESPELARGLARLSQIQALRGLPAAGATATQAIEVARRTGEVAAETNARINLFTARAGEGEQVDPAEVSSIVEVAVSAGVDEALRAIVNYLWSAALLDNPLAQVEQFVHDHVENLEGGLRAEVFERYLRLSLASLLYLPAGRWAEVDAVIADEDVEGATTRLVWLGLTAGMALRRGQLELADRHLPELRESALSSEEPQRIIPMASVALPRALIANDETELRQLVEIVSRLRWELAFGATSLPVTRVLGALGERELLERTVAMATAGHEPVVSTVASGLLEGLDGRHDEAARVFARVEARLHELGRQYDAACVALELGSALEAAGRAPEAADARARAAAVLEPLGCVHPY